MKCSDEISIGDYVRTEAGIFYKILSAVKNTFLCIEIRKNATKIEVLSDLEPVVKHSKNIINLLQIGDIITTNNLCGEITKIDGDTIYLANYMGTCKEENIKSVITVEQIKQIEYKIKE